MAYFRKAAGKLAPDDGLVVCTATPSWLEAAGDSPPAFRDRETPLFTLTRFLRLILGRADPRVRLILTGDKHHYAHYQPDETQPANDDQVVWVAGPDLITCGGAGAFTSSTHHLEEHLSVPWGRQPPSKPPLDTTLAVQGPRLTTRYTRGLTYPSESESNAMRSGIWAVGWWKNGAIFPVLVASLLLWVFAATVERINDPGPLLTAAPVLVLLVALVAFAATGICATAHVSPVARTGRVVGAALGHSVGYALCLAIAAVVWALVPHGPWSWVAVIVVFLIIGRLVFSAYLWTCDLLGFHELESFSSMRSTKYKSVLRMTFTDDTIDVRVIGMPDVPSSRSEEVTLGPGDPPLRCVHVDTVRIDRTG